MIQPIAFDRNDNANIGRPNWFSIDDWLGLIEQYITCDEVERALWLLENPPAFYRDFYPIKAKQLKDKLLTQFFTTVDYARDPVADEQIGACDGDVPRGEVVAQVCRALNDKGVVPNVVEYAPGNYWLPAILKRQEIKFKYYGETMEQDLQRRASVKFQDIWDKPDDGHTVFVCFEMLEHLHNPIEIYQAYLKTCPKGANAIFLSTPKYTFGGGMGNWYENALGHLRAYTPAEFHAFARKYWPEFQWSLYDGHVMCLKGDLNG